MFGLFHSEKNVPRTAFGTLQKGRTPLPDTIQWVGVSQAILFTNSRQIVQQGGYISWLCVDPNILLIQIWILPYSGQGYINLFCSERILNIKNEVREFILITTQENLFPTSLTQLVGFMAAHQRMTEFRKLTSKCVDQSTLFKSEYIGTWGNIT